MTDSYPQQFYTENGQLYVRANDVDAPKKPSSRRSTSKYSIEDLKRQSRIQSVSADRIELDINQPLLKQEKAKQKKLASEARGEKTARDLEELQKTPLLWADHLLTGCASDIARVKKQEATQMKVNDGTLVLDENKKKLQLIFMKGLPKQKLNIEANYQNAMAYINENLSAEEQTVLWTTLQKRNAHAKSVDQLVCISEYERKIKMLGETALMAIETEQHKNETAVVAEVTPVEAVPEAVQVAVVEEPAPTTTTTEMAVENHDN